MTHEKGSLTLRGSRGRPLRRIRLRAVLDRELDCLKEIANPRQGRTLQLPPSARTKARVILEARWPHNSTAIIADRLHLSPQYVRRVVRRFNSAGLAYVRGDRRGLAHFEAGSTAHLIQEALAALREHTPSELGYTYRRWSVRTLTQALREGCVSEPMFVSRETVRRHLLVVNSGRLGVSVVSVELGL